MRKLHELIYFNIYLFFFKLFKKYLSNLPCISFTTVSKYNLQWYIYTMKLNLILKTLIALIKHAMKA